MANLAVDDSFWRGRRVFLTGHTGFKGGWLSLWLQDLGAKVTGYALAPESGHDLFAQADIAAGMTDLRGDVRDLDALSQAIVAAQPSVVFHLAAQSLVRRSYGDPVGTLATNVMGTAHVCEAVRKAGANGTPPIAALVVITTDKCYDNREWLWPYRENDPLGGHDIYSSSKACAELVLASYRSSFASGATAMATARAGNVIGGGDWSADRLVPDAIRAFAAGEPLVLRNPDSLRPWQHVLEPLAGYLMLAQRLASDRAGFAEAWNFGPGPDADVAVSDVARMLAEAWGGGASWRVQKDDGPHEAAQLRLDSSKARFRLKWLPRLTLREAVHLTASWYLASQQGKAPLRELTLRQIRDYQARGA